MGRCQGLAVRKGLLARAIGGAVLRAQPQVNHRLRLNWTAPWEARTMSHWSIAIPIPYRREQPPKPASLRTPTFRIAVYSETTTRFRSRIHHSISILN